MASSNLQESGRHTPPPASAAKSAPAKSSPVGKVPPYFIQHKRDQVQAFEYSTQKLKPISREKFLKYLYPNNALLPPEIPAELRDFFSIDDFLSLANGVAKLIQEKREYHLLCIYLFL